ncbi:MAG: hypothetical protein HY815_18960 [Candidatus Riflebacteria bacterium]|nr:hypothetical protein [Candidatus Riflebacteria bacterium]
MNRSLLWVALVGLLATSAWGLDAPRNRPADDEEERPAGSARALQTLPDEAYQDENAAEEPEPEAAVEPAPKRPAPRPPVEEEDPTKLRFQRTTRIVMLGVEQEPASAPINPDNVLKLTRYEAQLHIRPDFTLKNDE